jgi:NAD(P)-dependent dehydrogenase (short-subunit alcohol dehydrogenase family)
MRSVVVTGTSTGIGWGTTKVLIARGFRVFGSVRKKADADGSLPSSVARSCRLFST